MAAQCTAQQCFVQVGRGGAPGGAAQPPCDTRIVHVTTRTAGCKAPLRPSPSTRRQQRPPGPPGQPGAARWSVQLQRVRLRLVQAIWAPLCGGLSHCRRRRRRRLLRAPKPTAAMPAQLLICSPASRLLTCPHASIPIGCRRGAHAEAGAAAGHHACGGAAARRQRQRGQG